MTQHLVIAVDGNNRIHSLYHATGNDGVLSLFFRQLQAVREQYKPRRVLVCFDSSPSFRKALCPAYKSSREGDESVDVLLAEAQQMVDKNPNFHLCMIDNMEADDLLASIAAQCSTLGWRVLLITADKDCRQCLVKGAVTIAKTVSVAGGKLTAKFETADDICGRFGVTPQQWPDYQTLIGDKGDDIDGVPGLGPKRATKLINEFGSVSAILERPERCGMSRQITREIEGFAGRVDTVRQLVTLRTDLDLGEWI